MNYSEYRVVCGTLNDIEYLVNQMISEGYQPFGSLQVIYNTKYECTRCYQAMVK